MTGEFGETLGRCEEKEVAVVGLLKAHDFGFEGMLALLKRNTNSGDFLS